MIVQVTEALLPELYDFCQTPFGCKIASVALSYGTSYPFARLWLQRDSLNRITAAVCKLDNALTLEARKTADFAEVSGFLHAIGGKSLLCAGEFSVLLSGWKLENSGPVLRWDSQTEPVGEAEQAGNQPMPREIHALLLQCESPSFPVPPFEPFYLDLSHRLRHGTALTAGICGVDGRLLACAVVSAKTPAIAVISAVAAAPECRRQGLGSRAVRLLLAGLGNRKVSLFRAKSENQEFYHALGFREWGHWAEMQEGL